jgi:hypothetical protein
MTFDAGAIEARLILNRTQFQSDLAAARSEGDAFENDVFEAKATLNTDEALAAIDNLKAQWDKLTTQFGLNNNINVSNADALSKIAAVELLYESVRETLQNQTEIKPGIDLSGITGGLSKLANTGAQNIEVDVNVQGASQGANALNQVSNAAHNASTNARSAYGAFGLLMKEITLWGGLFGSVHMLGMVQLWHILLDGLIEATVLVTETTVAMTETAIVAAPGIENIYTHLKAVDNVSKALGIDIPPVTGHVQQMGHAFASLDIEALGGVLNLFDSKTSTMGHVAEEVGTGIDNVIAKLDLWNNAQAKTGTLAQNGYDLLGQLGSVAGEVFLAFDNLVKADPGTVHFLLDVVEGGAKVLDLFSKIPTPILETVVAIHSFILWGGVLSSMLIKLVPNVAIDGLKALGVSIGALGTETEAASAASMIPLTDLRSSLTNVESDAGLLERSWGRLLGILSSPGAIAIGAGALAYFTYEAFQADTATKNFLANLQTSLANAPGGTEIGAITASIGDLNDQIAKVKESELKLTPVNYNSGYFSQEGQAISNTFDIIGRHFSDAFRGLSTGNISQMFSGLFGSQQSSDISAYTGEITNLTSAQDNLFRETGELTRQGYSFAQTQALLTLANVKTTDSFAVMQQKVDNLITGWQDMSIQGGLLASGVNAIQFAAEQSNSQITALTGGWDTFMKTVSGGDTTFIAFEQGMATLDTSTKASKASMDGLNTTSLTLRSNWESSLSSAGQYYDALATQASAAGLGAKGTAMLTQAGKDLVSQLIPMASHSKDAQAQLYAFAQIAGYSGPDSLKRLTEWLGNTKNATKQLDDITTTLTGDSAGLITDVENLATAINQNLDQAMSAAVFQATGGQKSFDDFANAVVKSHGNIDKMVPSAQRLANQLIAVLGNTTEAKNQFFAFTEQMGLTKSGAQALWNELKLIPKNLKETISVNGQGDWNVIGGGQGSQPGVSMPGFSAGGMVGGSGAGSPQLAVVHTGETIFPVSAGPTVAPIAAAMGLPGFAKGGAVGGYSGNLSGLGDWVLAKNAQTESDIAKQLAASIHSAVNVGLGSGGGGGGGMLSGNALVAQDWAKSHMAGMNWNPATYWSSLDALWTQESGWNAYAANPTSDARGIPQDINGWSSYAPGDYIAQILWGFNYISGRYGNPINAEQHERQYNWYDTGGMVPPGAQLIMNGTGRNEYMLHPEASDALMNALNNGSLANGQQPLIGAYSTNYYGTGDTTEAMHELVYTLRKARLELP